MTELIQATEKGLYCAPGDFYIDPWAPVRRAVVTHAHGDHARWGSERYFCADPGRGLLQKRMGPEAIIESAPYGVRKRIGPAQISFHPAGHLLGSAQVRVELAGEVWVVSGDYKIQPDPSCAPFETVPCDVFLTESTFGLPIYRWKNERDVIAEIEAWWKGNREAGRSSLLFAYALGKAQRILAEINPQIGPILVHGAVQPINQLYREAGIPLAETFLADSETAKATAGKALVIAPPSARGSPWVRKFQPFETAFASGWMQIRGARRRRALDRGFVLSDHADWDGLLKTIRATGAKRVGVMHGHTAPLTRYLRETGVDAWEVPTQYDSGADDEEVNEISETASST